MKNNKVPEQNSVLNGSINAYMSVKYPKTAIIILLHKKGDKGNHANCRSISLLS